MENAVLINATGSPGEHAMPRTTATAETAKASLPVIGALGENDLPEAARIVRLAFGSFLGAPDPETFWTDRDYVYGRQSAAHVASFGAKLDGRLVGSNFATNWGSVGFLGPLTVHPDVQERGIARALLAKTMERFDSWGTRHVGLFTFPDSAKHIALYQKYGFHARFLTALMSKPVVQGQNTGGWSRLSALGEAERNAALRSCCDVAETLYPGLDLSGEIRTTPAQKLGDTVLVEGPHGLAAFAVCQYGPRTEAGADTCYVKFGAVRDGVSAEQDYARLVAACESLGFAVGMGSLLVGANMARHEAYRFLVDRGYRTEIQGVCMHRANDPGYCRPGVYIIDDWR
jgi:GNAT superfamily N-acetyltransferase